MNSKKIFFTLLLLVLGLAAPKNQIWDEVISNERLESRIEAFNAWFPKFMGEETKVEARAINDSRSRVGLFAKEDLKKEDVYLTLYRKKMINSDLVHETKIGPVIKEAEAKYGYNDYNNMVFYLLHEMFNPDSELKPYIDLLPRQPQTVAFKYWENKEKIEEELIGTSILKKIVDYRILLDKKTRNLHSIYVLNNTEILDPELYTVENIEWACLILDTRTVYVDYEAFLAPMLGFVNYRQSSDNPKRHFRALFDEKYETTQIKAQEDYKRGKQVFENKAYSNDNYLIYHSFVMEDNYYDCYGVSFSFSDSNDPLKDKRLAFFKKFFLTDNTIDDNMEECVSLRNPFPRRLLFFHYTLLLDESDLSKLDHKRVGLETDKIVLEQVKNSLQSKYDLFNTSSEEDRQKLVKETDPIKKEIFRYLAEQKKYLVKIITHYQREINKLNKDEVL